MGDQTVDNGSQAGYCDGDQRVVLLDLDPDDMESLVDGVFLRRAERGV